MKRFIVYFSGHVQGVGFRYMVSQLAAGFDLIGTIQNQADNRVQLVMEGSEEELLAFVAGIEESQLGSHIRHKEIIKQPAQGGLKGFRII